MRIAAMALLVALAAGWSTGHVGLSLTLGAFLGRMIIAESLDWPLVHSAINPFRNLLLSFLFISVGLSLDCRVLLRAWPAVLAIAIVPIAAKVMLNTLASLSFRWSVPGSTQLGFLLVQGSEFAFVVFGLPVVRDLVAKA
jgi:CPA2 family monovalent cation:H+ antiporter-2